MKALVFLLVLANLLFYAFAAGYFGRPENPDAGRLERQVMPERMRILSRGEAPASAAKARPAAGDGKPAEVSPAESKADDKPLSPEPEATAEKVEKTDPVDKTEKIEKAEKSEPQSVCLSWRALSAADADRLSSLLEKRFTAYKMKRKVVATEGNGWWVSVPPQASRADADKKAGELSELGVGDFFVVPDGPTRFAISLGVFSSEKGAQGRLAELRSKGVRSAVLAPRPGKDSQVSLRVRGPAADKAALLAAVAQALPRSEALACE